MVENWCAFIIAIELNVTVEQAFILYWKGKLSRHDRCITKEDVEDMREMKKQGMSYAAIGEIYGITASSACQRIKGRNRNKIKFETVKESRGWKYQQSVIV